MTPHRRRCLIKAILEIKGALSITEPGGKVALISPEKLLSMTDDELDALRIELENAFDSVNITEPMLQLIQDTETIVMEAVVEKKKP